MNENSARHGADEGQATQLSELVWLGAGSEAPATGHSGAEDQAAPE
jgi:hypothetical protein